MSQTTALYHDSLNALEWLNEPPIWVGDGETLTSAGFHWGAAAVELLAAPALSSGMSETQVATEQRQVAERIVRGLRTWENKGGLELRYVWGDQPGRQHLRLILIARALGRQLESGRAWASQMLQNVTALFPPGYEFGPMQAAMPHDISAWAEIERTEEVRQPGPSAAGSVGYYYLVHPLGGSGSGWPSLARALASGDQPGFLSIALVPTTMTDLERQAVDHVCSIASYLAAPQQTYDFFGNQITNPADAGAEAVHLAWQRFPERSGVLARIGIAASAQDLHRVTSLVGSVLTEGSDQSVNPLPTKFKIVSQIGEFEAWQTATLGLVFPRYQHAVWSRPDEEAPITLERMPYFFSEQEAGGLFMLPVPDRQGVAGVPLARQAVRHRETVARNNEPATPGVRLGMALHQGQQGNTVTLPLTALNRHSLVVGSPGSGKTTTVMSLLVQLWREHRIPFLVLESVKAEYRTLLGTAGLEDLRVITLGNESLAPLRLNPLEPPPWVRCEVHQGAVMASLKMALPLFSPLPEILAKALPETYYRAGWDDDTTTADGLPAPTLRDLMEAYQIVFDKIGYRGEAGDIGRAFRIRLESLLQGSKGKLFDTMRSTDFTSLLAKPAVIEMNDLSDADEKAMAAAFILDRVRAGAKRHGSSGGQLRHVTVVEEAHRLLAKANVGSGDVLSGAQAKADSVRAFCEAIAELRSLGEGFVLSSQSPAALADAAVANTGTRILHRMESSADRNVMLDDLDADGETRGIAARLDKGEAVVRWPERDEIELVRVTPDASIDTGRNVSDDTVAEHMQEHRRQTTHMLPYQLCSPTVCTMGCRSSVRRRGARLAEAIGPSVRDWWADKVPDAEHRIASLLVAEIGYEDLQQTYCGAVHLSLSGDAFRPRPGRDDRPQLINIIRRATGA